MIIEGRNGQAVIHEQEIGSKEISQIYKLLEDDMSKHATLCFMPDVHYGKGCNIGTVMEIPKENPILPDVVSSDIGCGMTTAIIQLSKDDLTTSDFQLLDHVIRTTIPYGTSVHDTSASFQSKVKLPDFLTTHPSLYEKGLCSMMSLGSGNHFIEVGYFTKTNQLAITVHSGSRTMGGIIHKTFTSQMSQKDRLKETYRKEVEYLKQRVPKTQLETEIKRLSEQYRQQYKKSVHELTDPRLKQEYIEAVHYGVEFAKENRMRMIQTITHQLQWDIASIHDSVHNYIEETDTSYIIRKGATPAYKDQDVIIPMNMKDGILFCKGLGNPSWLCTAPHGAGRQFSRTEAKQILNLEDFKKDMEGIYSTCISEGTLDESRFAYKDATSIEQQIDGETVKVIDHIVPLYNFKG